MGQVTVFSGAQRRRRWSETEKIDLVARAFAPNATVSEVARLADVHSGQLYRWRAELRCDVNGVSDAGFARVVVAGDGVQSESGVAIRVRLGTAHVEIAGHAPSALVTATLKALVG